MCGVVCGVCGVWVWVCGCVWWEGERGEGVPSLVTFLPALLSLPSIRGGGGGEEGREGGMDMVLLPGTALFHNHTRRNTTSVRMRVNMSNVLDDSWLEIWDPHECASRVP